MDISEEEKNYISRIYQHGVSHLVDDSIPNRLICIHNLHWCIENLLRKATRDWNIDYRAGFEDIFKKFISKQQVPKNLEKSILDLNTMRNDVEHREIYHDISTIRKIITDVENFIKWIVKVVFKTAIDLFSISSADENKITEDFSNWKEQKLAINYKLPHENLGGFYDYIFICLIPATCSNKLVDFNFDSINQMLTSNTQTGVFASISNPEHESKIERYFRSFNLLFGSPAQVYTVSDHMKYYNETYGNEMKIFPDGRIYICFNYRPFNPDQPTFNLEGLFSQGGSRYITKDSVEKYGLPLDEYLPNNLEHTLKIICFSFNPGCEDKLVLNPTEYFRGLFLLPLMRFKGRDRILQRTNGIQQIFDKHREYGGDDDDISYSITFKYNDISKIVLNFKNWAYVFFKNKKDTGFSF